MAVVWRPPNRTLVNLSLYPCLPSGTDSKQNHPRCHSSPPSQDENIPTKTSDGVFLNFTTSTCSKSGAPSRAHHTTGASPRPNTPLAPNYRAHHATITTPDHDAAYGGTTHGFRPPTGRAAHPAQHGAWGPRMVSETGPNRPRTEVPQRPKISRPEAQRARTTPASGTIPMGQCTHGLANLGPPTSTGSMVNLPRVRFRAMSGAGNVV